jgi:hypothetical protein
MCLTLLEEILTCIYNFQSKKLVTTLFEFGDNLADESTLDAVGLNGDALK